MSRPTDHGRRLELATRAVEVLEREGLGISTERLATELGLKRPTLLYHFPTHGHVIETALVALMSEQALHVMATIEAHAHPIDRLFAQMKAVHAFHAGREHRIVFLTQAIATIGGERGREIVARGVEVFAAQRRAAAERVREGIARGEVAPCDADALVATMRALTDGLMVQRVTDGLDLRAAHRVVWEQLLAPLKRGGAEAPPKARSETKPAAKHAARAARHTPRAAKKSPRRSKPCSDAGDARCASPTAASSTRPTHARRS
jgi:AcrR family transcriptional regulator